jgi:hypothetical protein
MEKACPLREANEYPSSMTAFASYLLISDSISLFTSQSLSGPDLLKEITPDSSPNAYPVDVRDRSSPRKSFITMTY